MRRLLGTMTLAAVAGTGAAIGPAVAVAATQPQTTPVQKFGARLVDVPVSEANNPRGLRYIIDYLPTGTTIHRRILVQNHEKQTAHFTVYPDAAHISDESFTGDAGTSRSELTGWVSVQHPEVTLGPGASVMDMVTIGVPAGATRGEHYGVIWVQQAADARAAGGFQVKVVNRVGIRIYLAVGQGGAPPTSFAITSITGHRSAKGQPSLVADVDNTGGRAVDLNGTVSLTAGPGGTSAGPFPGKQIITLAPGQSGPMSFTPPKSLPDGPWQAKVTMVSGLTVATRTETIDFGVLASSAGLPMMAWAGIALALILVLVIAFFVVRHARRHRQVPA